MTMEWTPQTVEPLDVVGLRRHCRESGILENFTDEEAVTAYLWLENPEDDESDDGLPEDLVQTVGDYVILTRGFGPHPRVN